MQQVDLRSGDSENLPDSYGRMVHSVHRGRRSCCSLSGLEVDIAVMVSVYAGGYSDCDRLEDHQRSGDGRSYEEYSDANEQRPELRRDGAPAYGPLHH